MVPAHQDVLLAMQASLQMWGFTALQSTPGLLLFFCKELESSSRPDVTSGPF